MSCGLQEGHSARNAPSSATRFLKLFVPNKVSVLQVPFTVPVCQSDVSHWTRQRCPYCPQGCRAIKTKWCDTPSDRSPLVRPLLHHETGNGGEGG